MNIIGCDPGVNGGICLLSAESGKVLRAEGFKGLTEEQVWDLIMEMGQGFPPFWLEKVGYRPGDGGMGAFTFGKVYGMLRGMARGAGLTIYNVTPQIWMSSLNCLTGGNKNVSKNRAIELFPDFHAKRPRGITHAIADAMLIAEYGRRTTPPSSSVS
jgi:hypothetical protein